MKKKEVLSRKSQSLTRVSWESLRVPVRVERVCLCEQIRAEVPLDMGKLEWDNRLSTP